jgi:hypothetical protein
METNGLLFAERRMDRTSTMDQSVYTQDAKLCMWYKMMLQMGREGRGCLGLSTLFLLLSWQMLGTGQYLIDGYEN